MRSSARDATESRQQSRAAPQISAIEFQYDTLTATLPFEELFGKTVLHEVNALVLGVESDVHKLLTDGDDTAISKILQVGPVSQKAPRLGMLDTELALAQEGVVVVNAQRAELVHRGVV